MPKYRHQLNSKSAYRMLLLATIALAANFWAWSLLSPLGSDLADKLMLSPFTLSLLLAVPIIIGSLGRIPLGIWTDKFGGKKMLVIICVLTALPVAGLAFASNLPHYFLAAILLGLGGTAFVVGVPYINAWFTPGKRGLALGLYSIGDAGTAISGLTLPQMTRGLGWEPTFLTIAGIIIAIAIISAIWAKDSPAWRPAKVSAIRGLVVACRNKLTWDMSIVYAITFGAFIAFGVYLPVLLKVSYGLTVADAAARAGGFILIATLARPVGGWLSDHFGAKRIILIALTTIVPLATFVGFQAVLGLHTTIAYLTLAGLLGASSGAVFALLGRLTTAGTIGSLSGIVGAIGGLGGFLPPLVLGLSYQHFHSYALALILLAATSALALIYIARRFRDRSVYYEKYHRQH